MPPDGNPPDAATLAEANAILMKATGGDPPTVFDPFCGGGSTLVEAQRLGLPAAGSDLNPVPVLITRVLTELIPQVAGRAPLVADPTRLGMKVTGGPLDGFLADCRHYAERGAGSFRRRRPGGHHHRAVHPPGPGPRRRRQALCLQRGDSTVVVFNPGATGAAVPVLTISAGLVDPQGLVVDAAGVIWVTNTNNNTVTRYSPAGALLDTISGSGLNLPAGIALDASGRVVVSNFSGASLTSFVGTALVNTVVGGATLLAGPIGVAAVPVVTVTTATPLPDAAVGTPYSQSLVAAGGTGPYTWALASGSLPAGLSLSTAGVVSGTPTARGTSAFSVTVTDSANPAHSTTYAMSLRSRETTKPTCSWSVQSSPKRVDFTVTDAGAGLATVVVTTAVNIVTPVNIPTFTAGSTTPISFSALKADQTKSSQVAVVITDVDGNQASCA